MDKEIEKKERTFAKSPVIIACIVVLSIILAIAVISMTVGISLMSRLSTVSFFALLLGYMIAPMFFGIFPFIAMVFILIIPKLKLLDFLESFRKQEIIKKSNLIAEKELCNKRFITIGTFVIVAYFIVCVGLIVGFIFINTYALMAIAFFFWITFVPILTIFLRYISYVKKKYNLTSFVNGQKEEMLAIETIPHFYNNTKLLLGMLAYLIQEGYIAHYQLNFELNQLERINLSES